MNIELGTNPVTDAELAALLVTLNAARKAELTADYAHQREDGSMPYDKHEALVADVGPKYIKLSRRGTQPSGSVYCFIERATGNIFKAASWKAPAKHARGNVRDVVLYGVRGVNAPLNVYGAAYLR